MVDHGCQCYHCHLEINDTIYINIKLMFLTKLFVDVNIDKKVQSKMLQNVDKLYNSQVNQKKHRL